MDEKIARVMEMMSLVNLQVSENTVSDAPDATVVISDLKKFADFCDLIYRMHEKEMLEMEKRFRHDYVREAFEEYQTLISFSGYNRDEQ